ncbi:unnamed protein product [Didymodactylos carnosus]|uniref:Cysteine dioxygenase n=1 Tax=Didymodactylos carnosus TaxID=1234261 RepID=A0A814UQA3_9BILA|nr:unnamed protein product [Didymodactylos carnosus]CAF1177705.1 unnamed protein product [Didymodactylos carnosus]CAF3739917.1 unnamed protein product [Didymodactylos carnosus]CAF3941874.1 unnamed protein product [Didymodactylos carnosus]
MYSSLLRISVVVWFLNVIKCTYAHDNNDEKQILTSEFWQENCCSKILKSPGQGTIIINESVPFHILLKNKLNFNKRNQYWLILSINKEKLMLRKIFNNRQTILKETADRDYVLQRQEPTSKSAKYWLSVDSKNFIIKYGRGELREMSTLFSISMADDIDRKYWKKLKYTYSKFNSYNETEEIEEDDTGSNERSRCHYLQEAAIGSDLPILVSEEKMLDDDLGSNRIIAAEDLDKPNQRLYKIVINFQLVDPECPNFIHAIEHSCHGPSGWCYKTLHKKAANLSVNINSTSFRIKVSNQTITELWPPNHRSKIHQHSPNTYGVIRILYGKLVIEFYPYISVNNPQQQPLLQQICEKNIVTYIKSGLNQIYRLSNTGKDLSIFIQSYDTGNDSFKYIDQDQKQSKLLKPSTDIDYEKFKKLIRQEWHSKGRLHRMIPSSVLCARF